MKRSRALPLLTILLIAGASARALPGDVNNDGSVTTVDAVLASRVAAHLDALTSGQRETADVAGAAGNFRDSDIDWRDVTRITRIAGGLEDLPDPPVQMLGNILQSVTLEADTVRNFTFSAFTPPDDSDVVRGHVSGLPDGTSGQTLRFANFRPDGYTAPFATLDGHGGYRIHLAPAEYLLYFGATVTESAPNGTFVWTYVASLNQTVQVNGPMVLDVAAAAPPTPGQVTGEIHATNIIPTSVQASPLGFPFTPIRDLSDLRDTITGVASADAYLIKGLPADYRPKFRAVYTPDPSITFDWYSLSLIPVQAGSTMGPAYSLPTAVPASFQFTVPPGATLQTAGLDGGSTTDGILHTAASVPPGSSVYSTAFAPGPAQLSFTLHPENTGNLVCTADGSIETTVPDGGGTQTVSLPPLPEMVTFSGRVTLPDGSPAAGASVALQPVTSTSEPSSFYYMTSRSLADADGHFTVRAIPGRYQVYIPGHS